MLGFGADMATAHFLFLLLGRRSQQRLVDGRLAAARANIAVLRAGAGLTAG
jgi:hypothetical protein